MSDLGKKISQARKQKGISQEKLSEDANINLRTLQRIENGATNPHGDTLIRISESLGIPLEELVSYGLEQNIGYIKATHFSALIFVLLPLGNILLPLIFWLTKKDKIENLAFYSKKLLNFQISWSILTYFPFLYTMLNLMLPINLPIPKYLQAYPGIIMYIYPLVMYGLNFVYLLVVGAAISKIKRNFFPVAIRFMK